VLSSSRIYFVAGKNRQQRIDNKQKIKRDNQSLRMMRTFNPAKVRAAPAGGGGSIFSSLISEAPSGCSLRSWYMGRVYSRVLKRSPVGTSVGKNECVGRPGVRAAHRPFWGRAARGGRGCTICLVRRLRLWSEGRGRRGFCRRYRCEQLTLVGLLQQVNF
jgi:hypothetical protein